MDFREQEESQERKAFRQIVREWMEYHKPQISSQPSGNGRLPAETQAEVRKSVSYTHLTLPTILRV